MNETTNTTSTNDTIDLADFLRTYFRKWKILLPISIVFALLAFVFLVKFYNPGRKRIHVNFVFNFPEISTGYYPNGTTYDYSDFTSLQNLTEVIAKDNVTFNKLDAQTLFSHQAIQIKPAYLQDKEGTILEYQYQIDLKASYFNNNEQANKFVLALIENIREKIKLQSEKMYYRTYLDSYSAASSFENKLQFLGEQQDLLLERYDSWIKSYGGQYQSGAKNLSRYREDVALALTSEALTKLRNEYLQKLYVFTNSADAKYDGQIEMDTTKDELEDLDKKIDGLVLALSKLREGEVIKSADITTTSNESYYYETIAQLTERKVELERKIKNLEKLIQDADNRAESQAYASKLDSYYDKLLEQTVLLEGTVAPALYNEKTFYALRSGFTSSGEFSPYIGAIAMFILAYLGFGFLIFLMSSDTPATEKTPEKESEKQIKKEAKQ